VSHTGRVELRPAVTGDAETVFGWRNDPFLVARASSQQNVFWAEHLRWFEETLASTSRKMFIVLVDGLPAGQVRFERIDDASCSISAYLLEPYTGQGLGVEAIRQGCAVILDNWSVDTVVAFIRADNAPSQAAFRKAGFLAPATGECPPNHVALAFPRCQRKEAAS
jgi:RimJ/RimL family protein N-acetyltransferase